MSTRRRSVAALVALVAVFGIVCGVIVLGAPSEKEQPDTSAFDPSVPTSTQTPPPAGPADPTDDPAGDPTGDPTGAPTEDPSDAPTGAGDPSDAPSGTASPSPSSPLTADEQAEVSSETSTVLSQVLGETAEIDPGSPKDVVGDLSDQASQAYLSELQSERLEFETEGWSRTGSYSLGDIEVTDFSSTSDGEVATVQVCVDSSELVTRRADGEVLATAPTSERAWNIFVLERPDNAAWRIVGRTFPNDPAC